MNIIDISTYMYVKSVIERAFLVFVLETFFIAIVLYSRSKLSASEYAKNN